MLYKNSFLSTLIVILAFLLLLGCSPADNPLSASIKQAEDSAPSAIVTVSEIPQGFVSLTQMEESPYWTLTVQLLDETVCILNAYHTCIFETYAKDTNFIVEYQQQCYINEVKMEELLFGPVCVDAVPQGYVAIQEMMEQSEHAISYMFFENQIMILDAEGICIYQTLANNTDFIVSYDNTLFVSEASMMEIDS